MTNVKPRILAVDDERWNISILESYLVPQGYEIVPAGSAREALELLAGGSAFDLILTDAMMPGKDGFELCREIKQNKQYSSIPILLITALQETQSKVKGLEAGASDFISKPVDSAELGARIRAHLRIKTLMDEIASWNHALEQKVEDRTRDIIEKNRQLDEAYFLTVEALTMALDARERETGKHSLRVAFYAAELARKAGVHGRDLEEIAMGALLHDIGKIGIPDGILLKPGKLSHDEWIIMRKHPEIGWKLIKDIEFFGKGREVVLQHQECYDGSGYPYKLKGDEIFLGARLFAVVDTLDVLMSERSYKGAMPYEMARVIIQKSSGIHFDPKAVEIFLQINPARWQELREGVKQGSLKSLIREIRSANHGDNPGEGIS
jgi:putative two-component system response regulator